MKKIIALLTFTFGIMLTLNSCRDKTIVYEDGIHVSSKADTVFLDPNTSFAGFSVGPMNDVWIAVRNNGNVTLKMIRQTSFPSYDPIIITAK